ncbi:MAG: hypothetical protein RJA70_4927 [Pseudomonadota bacterium]|jgi:chemotaxis protein methyltransferase CheR
MTVGHFQSLVTLIHQRTGIEVPSPSPQFEQGVRQRLKDLGTDLEAYVETLKAREISSDEWLLAVQNATNRLTHFMRDDEQLHSAIRLAVDAQKTHGAKPVQVWSAGCATGEEPYTLAILGMEAGLDIEVLGTDVNKLALDVAKRGLFAAWALRRVTPELRRRYFDETDTGTFQVRKAVQDRVQFEHNNLVLTPAPFGRNGASWHAIICRNVLIYYKDQTIEKILLKMSANLAPCGFLVLGASETVAQRRLPLRPCLAYGRIVYGALADHPAGLRTLRSVQDLSDKGSRSIMPASLRAMSAPPPQMVLRPSDSGEMAHAALPESYLQIQEVLLQCLETDHAHAALEALSSVVRSSPRDICARLSLGHMYLREHRFLEAQAQYEAALECDDSVAEAHFFLGLVLRKTRQTEAAVASFRRAVFLEPGFWSATFLLGTTARRVGHVELARSEYRRTLDLLDSAAAPIQLVTHPLFHAQFLDPVEVVRAACEAGLETVSN